MVIDSAHGALRPFAPTEIQAHKGIVRLKPVASPRLRLVCFPFAGGSAAAFHRWGRDLPDDIELIALQYPGRGGRFREPRLTELSALIDDAQSAVLTLSDRPLVFFGHSMGASIAFELARRLERVDASTPRLLFLSGRASPDSRISLGQRHKLADAALLTHLRDLAGTPDEVLDNQDLLDLLLPVLRSDLQAIETWVTQDFSPVQVPLVVFGGLDDPIVPAHTLDGWRAFSAAFQKRVFPGHHFFINEHQSLLLALMLSRLREAGIY